MEEADHETGLSKDLLKEIQVLEKMNICYDIINQLKPNWGLDWESFETDMKNRRNEIEEVCKSYNKTRKENTGDISFLFFLFFIKYVYNNIHSLLNTEDTSYLSSQNRMEKFQDLKRYLMKE